MKLDNVGYDFIKAHEGLILHAYKDQVGVWTIGYGTIKYPNGAPVKKGDIITEAQANILLQNEADAKATIVDGATNKSVLTQNQFNALVSLTYNIGTKAFLGSTVLKLVRVNPNDPNIAKAFQMWCKGHVDGKAVTLPGLLKRRKEEVKLYFS